MYFGGVVVAQLAERPLQLQEDLAIRNLKIEHLLTWKDWNEEKTGREWSIFWRKKH